MLVRANHSCRPLAWSRQGRGHREGTAHSSQQAPFQQRKSEQGWGGCFALPSPLQLHSCIMQPLHQAPGHPRMGMGGVLRKRKQLSPPPLLKANQSSLQIPQSFLKLRSSPPPCSPLVLPGGAPTYPTVPVRWAWHVPTTLGWKEVLLCRAASLVKHWKVEEPSAQSLCP